MKKGASGTVPTNLERREITLKEAVFTAATYLPENTSWQEVVRRRLFDADTGELITDWQDVKSLTTDQLHADLGGLVRLKIEYEVDLDLRSEGLKPLSEEQATQLRGTVAGMSWAGRQGRPELAAPASMIASCFPPPTVANAKSANAVVQRAKALKYNLTLWAFKEEELRRVCIEDSAFDPLNKKSQHGWIIGYTTPALALGREAPVSIVAWVSKRLRQKADSSLLCEAQSANISAGQWIRAATLEMMLRFSDFKIGMPLFEAKEEAPTVLSKKMQRVVDPAGMLVMDAKSLYDAMQSEQASQDNARAALHASMTKETVKDLGAIPRWVPHDKNPADALTKCDGAHCTPLIELTTKGRWKLTFEEEELAKRAEYREMTGKSNPRPRHSKVQKPQQRRRATDGNASDDSGEWHYPGFQFKDANKVRPRSELGERHSPEAQLKHYAYVVDKTAPLPTVQEFPVSPVTEAATEAFQVWKQQVQMPDLELVSATDSDDSLDAFVAHEMPRVGKAAL